MPNQDLTLDPDRPGTRANGAALVLVVERDAHVRDLQAHFLEAAGFEVAMALDGRAALEDARRLLPDVIVTEILIPKLDGLALCRHLKAEPATRAIAVVVLSMLAARSRAHEAGADAFLLKPLSEHGLVGTVTELLRNRTAPEDPHG